MQYPKGYLKKAYEIVRSRGGLCVSDEVSDDYNCRNIMFVCL